jgi:hypothetical protein
MDGFNAYYRSERTWRLNWRMGVKKYLPETAVKAATMSEVKGKK